MIVANGPLHAKRGPFVIESTSLSPSLSLCRAVRGLTGKGKSPRLTLVTPNPTFDPTSHEWSFDHSAYSIVGEAYPSARHGTKCWTAKRWNNMGLGWVEGFFETRELAEQFLTRNATCFG